MLISNEILALLNDVINCFKDLDLFKLNDDEKKNLKIDINEKFEVLNQRKNDLLNSMIFIADAKADKNFFNLVIKNDRKLMLDLFNLGRLMTLSIENIKYSEESATELNVKIFTFRRSIIDSIYVTKKLLVGYALYRK